MVSINGVRFVAFILLTSFSFIGHFSFLNGSSLENLNKNKLNLFKNIY